MASWSAMTVPRVKAPAEVAGRRRVGQARCPYAVEEHPVGPAGLDVVEGHTAAQGVVGDVEHVVGLEVGRGGGS